MAQPKVPTEIHGREVRLRSRFRSFVYRSSATVFLAIDGSWGKALILTKWGFIVIGGMDNLLLPIRVGNRLKLHTILAFVSVVGGLMVFWGPGLILGPVVLTITMMLLEIWRHPTTSKAVTVVAPAPSFRFGNHGAPDVPEPVLPPREQEILTLLSAGYLYKGFSDRLGIGIEKVRTYVKNICKKMHVRNRVEAVAKRGANTPVMQRGASTVERSRLFKAGVVRCQKAQDS